MAIFVVADTHFGHKNIIRYHNRPYRDVAAMDFDIAKSWNRLIGAEDTVYHLGDFAVGKTLISPSVLYGKIILVRGNHDYKMPKAIARQFADIVDHAVVKVNGKSVYMSHYPLLTWPGQSYGTIHLHGHGHGRYVPVKNALDVGMDSIDSPARIDVLLAAHSTSSRGFADPSVGRAIGWKEGES